MLHGYYLAAGTLRVTFHPMLVMSIRLALTTPDPLACPHFNPHSAAKVSPLGNESPHEQKRPDSKYRDLSWRNETKVIWKSGETFFYPIYISLLFLIIFLHFFLLLLFFYFVLDFFSFRVRLFFLVFGQRSLRGWLGQKSRACGKGSAGEYAS